MKKALLGIAVIFAMAGSAEAGVITLQSLVANGPSDFTFTYQGTLGPDEGVVSGDRLIIYDFRGYIAGSIFSDIATVTATTELTSPGGVVTPGFDDDPGIVNLVFTYAGPPFRASGGPLPPFDFDGLGAHSTLGGMISDAFFGLSTKNNADGVPGGSGTKIFSLGEVAVPNVAIPEPTSWAMMLGGFGLLGLSIRRGRRARRLSA